MRTGSARLLFLLLYLTVLTYIKHLITPFLMLTQTIRPPAPTMWLKEYTIHSQIHLYVNPVARKTQSDRQL